MNEGVIAIDTAGLVAAINPAAERLCDCLAAVAVGRPHTDIFRLRAEPGSPDSAQPFQDCLAKHQELRSTQPASLIQPGDATDTRSIRWRVIPDAGGGAVLIFEDVTRMSLISQELEYRAHFDPLTGLLNREEFEQRLRAAQTKVKQSGARYRLCFIDLDRFRLVNETAGHFAGDEMLRDIATLLRSRLRGADQLARLGGDEFAALLLDDENHVGPRTEDILRQAVRAYRFTWEQRTYSVTASFGVAPLNAETTSIAKLMADADIACRTAKDAGRDRIRHANTDLARRHGEITLMGRFSDALHNDRFTLYSEDVVDLKVPGRVVYRELLVRWRDEDGTLLLPPAFIQTAERYFLITALDRWVVSAALRHLASSPDNGIVHAVNLSGQSLVDAEFLDFVLDQLRNSGVKPSRLCFEVTETAAISRLSEAVHFLRELSDVGVQFSLDDFGTGMASFTYLRNLPVQYLKIDGSFVHAMLENTTDRSMVEAIHRVGHDMGLLTIAEGVETESLIEPLRRIGVDLAQGHAISMGRPLDELS